MYYILKRGFGGVCLPVCVLPCWLTQSLLGQTVGLTPAYLKKHVYMFPINKLSSACLTVSTPHPQHFCQSKCYPL